MKFATSNARPNAPIFLCETFEETLKALLDHTGGSVLAVIVGATGPTYRPLGAIMAVLDNGDRIGALSSGCIDSDIQIHSQEAIASGELKVIRYGVGSPYRDIKLPCGGGLDVAVIPNPDKSVIAGILNARDARRRAHFGVDLVEGTLSLCNLPLSKSPTSFSIELVPEVQFVVFGAGPEVTTFTALVSSCSYQAVIYSHDVLTREACAHMNCETRPLSAPKLPADVEIDDRTAIILFFHDHAWEPEILLDTLQTDAFYIGAQGSQRVRAQRDVALEALGATAKDISRIRGPIGLIPSTRDARTLSVSVLAETLQCAKVEA
ncbi:MAG: XdhC family protein [Cognatishimia sp.]